ncbi:MAG: DUF805 domain-containing protein [Bacteroides sp.]|nr:DUF805 domain-containing protein [Bacteroides sp.]MCM1095726.1 DUF805 domain-containing protein [Terasakiella sp.]
MPPFNMDSAAGNNNATGAPSGQSYGTSTPPPAPQMPQTMTFMESVNICFSKYCDFNGRASRAEFWWWILFTVIVGGVCGAISQWLGYVANLALLLPTLSVSWRRLHDIGRAGGYYFIGLIPLVGWIIVIIWYATAGQPMVNRFGPQPVK